MAHNAFSLSFAFQLLEQWAMLFLYFVNFLYKSSKCFLLNFWLSIGLILELNSRNLNIYGIWYALSNNHGAQLVSLHHLLEVLVFEDEHLPWVLMKAQLVSSHLLWDAQPLSWQYQQRDPGHGCSPKKCNTKTYSYLLTLGSFIFQHLANLPEHLHFQRF